MGRWVDFYMYRYSTILLFIGLAWGQDNFPYFPKIDLLGFDISTWYILGWFNIFSGKIILIYYGYKKGWDISRWLTLILFATTGAAIGSLFLPSIVGVLIGFIGCIGLFGVDGGVICFCSGGLFLKSFCGAIRKISIIKFCQKSAFCFLIY